MSRTPDTSTATTEVEVPARITAEALAKQVKELGLPTDITRYKGWMRGAYLGQPSYITDFNISNKLRELTTLLVDTYNKSTNPSMRNMPVAEWLQLLDDAESRYAYRA